MLSALLVNTPPAIASLNLACAVAGSTSAILRAITIFIVLPNCLHFAALPLNMKSPERPPPSKNPNAASISASIPAYTSAWSSNLGFKLSTPLSASE